jgi:hypothetical protein
MSKISEEKKEKYYMNKNEKYTAHCLVYIVTNIKFKIQNRSHEMKNITTANKNTHTVAQRINMINEEEKKEYWLFFCL